MTNFLRSRWLYFVLAGLAGFLYIYMFTIGPHGFMIPAERPIPMTHTVTQHSEEPNLSPKELLHLVHQRPHIVTLLALWVTVTIMLTIGGIGLSVQAFSTGNMRRLIGGPSRVQYFWSLADLGRVLALIVLVVLLLPFVRLALVALGLGSFSDWHLWAAVGMCIVDGLLISLIWAFSQAHGAPFASVFGLSGRQTGAMIRQGVLGYMAVFPWVFGLLWIIARAADWLGVEPPAEPIQELLFTHQSRPTVVLTLLLACIIGPIAEELFFRGVLFSAVRKRASRWVALLVSGSLFAGIHTNLIGFLPILLLGCLLAELYEQTGSLLSPIVVHIFHNTLLISLGLLMKGLTGN